MRKLIIIVFFIAYASSSIVAQMVDENKPLVTCDAKIDSLLNLHIEYGKQYPIAQGYRIQILKVSGNEAIDIIEQSKTDFSEKYPDMPIYLTFNEPDYRVRVGDFRTRLEAEKFLKKINRKYSGAWVIQDDINFPVLPKYNKNQKL